MTTNQTADLIPGILPRGLAAAGGAPPVQDVATDDRVDPQTGEVVNITELARLVADHQAAVRRERELRAQAAEAESTLVRVLRPTDVVDGPGYSASLFTGKRGKRQVNTHAVQEIRDRLVGLGLIEAKTETVYGSLTIADLDRADVQAKLRRADIDPASLELERRDTTTVAIVWD